MRNVLIAAGNALAMVFLWGVIMLIPGLNVLGLIAVMLPLWMAHDMGIRGLGAPREGFFLPSEVGFAIGALILWTLCFLLFLVFQRRKAKGRND